MQHDTPTKDRGRHSDPTSSGPNPLIGNFVSLSPTARARSLSPRKRLGQQPLHIRMNLTEKQVDKITNAFSSQSTQGSGRQNKKKNEMTTPKSTSRKNKASLLQNETSRSQRLSRDGSGVASPTFSELMPQSQRALTNDLSSSSLAERRQKAPPPRLQLDYGQRHENRRQAAEMDVASELVSPLSQERPRDCRFSDGDCSSLYSTDVRYSAHPEPLDLRGHGHTRSRSKVSNTSIDYQPSWYQKQQVPSLHESEGHPQTLTHRPRRSKSTAEGFEQYNNTLNPPPLPQPSAAITPLFSPLQFYFRGPDFPTAKKGEKVMIGDNGWLERTDEGAEQARRTPQKKVGILDGIKKIAKDMADLHHNNRRMATPPKKYPSSQVAISLNAREQSLLFCELEFHLSTVLNDYITIQLDKGRLVPDKFKKVADIWQQKGRPKVVGFRFDLETQIELVNLHIDDFRFYGRRQADPIEIGGLLHAMKSNARSMSIRTFCQPDSVIAKQLVDSQSLFKMLGVPESQNMALAEVAHFFKAIVDREKEHREHRERDGRRTMMAHNRNEPQWAASSR